MTREHGLQEVRPRRFEERYGRRQRRELAITQPAEMLEITERTIRRWSGRYDIEGAEGGRTGGSAEPPARAVSVDDALRRGMREETRPPALERVAKRGATEEEGPCDYSRRRVISGQVRSCRVSAQFRLRLRLAGSALRD